MDYKIEVYAPSELTPEMREQCIELIVAGDAVNPRSAENNLPQTHKVAIITNDGKAVGVGAIKQIRRNYASQIALKSSHPFPSDLHELGYIAIDEQHRGNNLSEDLIVTLLSSFDKPLFATTASESIMETLKKNGFMQKGNSWQGQTDMLSLWIREA